MRHAGTTAPGRKDARRPIGFQAVPFCDRRRLHRECRALRASSAPHRRDAASAAKFVMIGLSNVAPIADAANLAGAPVMDRLRGREPKMTLNAARSCCECVARSKSYVPRRSVPQISRQRTVPRLALRFLVASSNRP